MGISRKEERDVGQLCDQFFLLKETFPKESVEKNYFS